MATNHRHASGERRRAGIVTGRRAITRSAKPGGGSLRRNVWRSRSSNWSLITQPSKHYAGLPGQSSTSARGAIATVPASGADCFSLYRWECRACPRSQPAPDPPGSAALRLHASARADPRPTARVDRTSADRLPPGLATARALGLDPPAADACAGATDRLPDGRQPYAATIPDAPASRFRQVSGTDET